MSSIEYEFNAQRLRQENLIKREAVHIERQKALKRLQATRNYNNRAIELYSIHEQFDRLSPELQRYAVVRMKDLANSLKLTRRVYPEGKTAYPLPKKEY